MRLFRHRAMYRKRNLPRRPAPQWPSVGRDASGRFVPPGPPIHVRVVPRVDKPVDKYSERKVGSLLLIGHDGSMTTQVQALLLSNETTPPEYRVICEGYPLEYETDKFVHVDSLHKHMERVKGETYATWTVLCYRDDLDADEVVIHPYIVWTLSARPEGWSFSDGGYYTDYDTALNRYKERTGR